MNNIFIEFLPPWVETGLQPAFYDKESGTVLQQTARMYAKMNELIANVNKFEKDTKDVVDEYIAKFVELYDYVHDYFDNLDVQEEINNKLDAMVEAGTLQEIIATYLQSNVTWTFDTVADMKLSDNLVAGSYAKTLGFHTLNDDGGATYYITDTGTANEMDVIAVGDLYANLVKTDVINVKQFGAYGDGTTNDTDAIAGAIDFADEGDTLIFPTATYICNIYCTKGLHFDMQGSKLIANSNAPVLAIRGTKSSSGYVLTADLARNDRQISFLNTGNLTLEAGDYILLRDDSERPGDGLKNINEEVHQIESISSNTIVLKDYVRYKKAIATSTANIYKLEMVNNISIKNVDIEDNNLGSAGIQISYCDNIKIENIQARSMTLPVVALISSVNIEVSRFDFGASATVDAGHGYGVLLDHGSNAFCIKDGRGDKQRHVVDCSSVFDGKVENVISTNGQGASFVMAHNSYGSDITFESCHADGDWVGFVYVAQGVANYYDMTAYNFNILNCTAHLENASANSVGCFFQCPAQDCTIDNFTVKGKVLNEYGIGVRVRAINNRILINNCKISTVRTAVDIEDEAVAESDNLYYIRLINNFFENTTFGIRLANVKQIFIDKLYTDGCRTILFTGAYDAGKTNALKFFNLTNAIFKGLVNLFVFNNSNYEAATYIVGKINNINMNTAQGNYQMNVTSGAKLANDVTALNGRYSMPEGIIIPVKATGAVTTATDFIPKGITLYQTVTLINYSANTITLPNSDDIKTISGSDYALAGGTSTKYIWNGSYWKQI